MNKMETLNVSSIINTQKLSKIHWKVLILCFLIVAVDGFDTALMGYIAPSIINDFSIDRASLWPAMSAALFGLAIGSLFSGPLADRFGRKLVLIISVGLFGVCSLVTATADSVQLLTLWRFLTGLGLGATMSNAITLMSEYAPENRRSLLINTVFCGFPLGAAASGFVAAWIIPHFGWQGVLVLGGVIPILLSVLILLFLPESLRYLVSSKKSVAKIRQILTSITDQTYHHVKSFTFNEQCAATSSAIGTILSKPFIIGTLMLWLTYFMGLLIFYVLTSWMPLLMNDVGFSIATAAMLTALFPLGGGLGTILSGWLMDRVNPHRIVAGNYILTGILLFLIGHGNSLALLSTLIFLAGTTMNGAQASMGSIAALYYPTSSRATGVAWMLGFGRIGGICGALFGAELIKHELSYSSIFTLLSIPALIAAIALLYKDFRSNRAEQAILSVR